MSKSLVTFEVNMDLKVLSKTKAKELKSLASKKERDKENLFLLEGEKSFLDTCNAFNVKYLVCTKNWIDTHQQFITEFHDKILLSDRRGIEIISSFNSPSEIIAVYEKPQPMDGIPELGKNKFYLLLDEIQDPGNLGTIIRTCDWFGVYEIFASKNTVDVYSPKVVQATMGSLSRVTVHYLD